MKKLALVIYNAFSREPLERWDFNIDYETEPISGEAVKGEKLNFRKAHNSNIHESIQNNKVTQIARQIAYTFSSKYVCSFL